MSCIGPKFSVSGGLGGISVQGNAIGPKYSVAGALGGVNVERTSQAAPNADSMPNLLEGVDLKNIKLE